MKYSPVRYLRFVIRKLRHWLWRVTVWHGRFLLRTAVVLALLLACTALSWQFWFIPRLEQYRPRIVAEISQAAGVPIQVGELVGGWDGISPKLTLRQVRTLDQYGLPALAFEQLDGALAWWTLPLGKLRFSRINLIAPELRVVRLQDGGWRVAGFTLSQEANGQSGLLDWLLDQDALNISRGRLLLLDEESVSWALDLNQLKFESERFFGKRRFKFSFVPPAYLGQTVRGEGVVSGGNLQQLDRWAGNVQFTFPQVDLPTLQTDIVHLFPKAEQQLPRLEQGQGKVEVVLSFAQKQLLQMDADFTVQQLQLEHQEKRFHLPLIEAVAHWEGSQKAESLVFDIRRLNTEQGILTRDGRVSFAKRGDEYEVGFRAIKLSALSAYAAWLPQTWAEKLVGAHLAGELKNLRYVWQGDFWQPSRWQGEIALNQLDVYVPFYLPRLGKLDVSAHFDGQDGQISLGSHDFVLDWPAQFVEPIRLNLFDSVLNFKRLDKGWEVQTPALQMVNTETNLSLAAYYRWAGEGLGYLDLSGNIVQVPAQRVYAYLPREVGDETLEWLKTALRSGRAIQGKAQVRGNLEQFPFAQGEPGLFKITANARDVTLAYESDWPSISGINGDLRFEGNSMFIHADSGKIFGVQLSQVNTRIADLSLDNPHLLIEGAAQGKAADFLRFVAQSPVKTYTEGFLDDASATGRLQLGLKLDIPLNDADATVVAGDIKLQNNAIDLKGGIPPLSQAKGQIQFTESSLALKEVKANALGGHALVSGRTDANGLLKLALQGQADLKDTAQFYSLPLAKQMSGKVAFKGDVQASDDQYTLKLESDLLGARLAVPAPLGKQGNQARALSIQVSEKAEQTALSFNYANLINASLAQQGKQAMAGWVNLGALPAAPPHKTNGIQVIGGWPYLDVAAWQVLTQGDHQTESSAIDRIDLKFDQLSAWGKHLHALNLHAAPLKAGWAIDLESREVAGHVEWVGGKQARLFGRLSRLYMPLNEPNKNKPPTPASFASSVAVSSAVDTPYKIKPILDLQINDLRYKNSELGQATVQAQPNPKGWLLSDVRLENPDGKVAMTGQWFNSQGVNRTEAKFSIQSENTGKLMARLGYVDALQRAPAKLQGQARWEGAPYSPNIATMQGSMRVDVKAGQFAKIDPGAGRLLSLISLQSLTRRIKLDFSDVYSEGLEFDAIAGDVRIENGVARTDNLEIASTSSRIAFKGEANLVAETQNIRVRIVPILGDAASIAVGAVNPIAGAAAFALGRLFKDPLGRLISYEYQITGDMQNPQINKVK